MTCEECQKLLPEYVTGGLDASESAAVRAHLMTGCPRCEGELAAAEAAFHEVGLSLAPLPVPAGAWEKLERRMAAAGAGGVVERGGGRRGGGAWWAGWAAAAASLLVMGVLLWRSTERSRELAAQNAKNEQQLGQLAQSLAGVQTRLTQLGVKSSEMQQALEASGRAAKEEIVRLASAKVYELGAAAQSPEAKLFWNKGDGTWTVVASKLKALPAGKTYELWIINDKGEKIGAGTFDPDKEGRAMHEVKLPTNAGTIVMAAVTDEVAGGVVVPAGEIQFAGKL